MKISAFSILILSIIVCVPHVHGNVVKIEAKFNESNNGWRSWVFPDRVGESSTLEISKDYGVIAYKITYKISRENLRSQFLLDQNVVFRNGKKVSKYIWSESKITVDVSKVSLIKSVEMTKDGSIKFNSELVPIKFSLMTDSGKPLR